MKEQNFIIVNGLAIGEETKGNSVQSLVRKTGAHTVWRSGGWQGGHHIIAEDGREMAFSFFGAGTFDGAATYLRNMVISPVELFDEAMELEAKGISRPLELISIDQSCISTTPFHSAISRLREILRGENRKGTIGKGVGEAVRDSLNTEITLRAGDFADSTKTARIVENIRRVKLLEAKKLIQSHAGEIAEEAWAEMAILEDRSLGELVTEGSKYLTRMVAITDGRYFEELINRRGSIVNEVSHGALHHPWYGFVPHVTQIDPTSEDVMATLAMHNYDGKLTRIGVVRSYMTRHGAGPLPSFNSELSSELIETHNDGANEWLGEFRCGNFDAVLIKYALNFAGQSKSFDGLMVSHFDVLQDRSEWRVCETYEYLGGQTDLENYFDVKDGLIIGIKRHPNTRDAKHYHYQLRLTELIKNCRPVMSTLTGTSQRTLEDTFTEYVESELGVPIIGRAYGPGLNDRYFSDKLNDLIGG